MIRAAAIFQAVMVIGTWNGDMGCDGDRVCGGDRGCGVDGDLQQCLGYSSDLGCGSDQGLQQ